MQLYTHLSPAKYHIYGLPQVKKDEQRQAFHSTDEEIEQQRHDYVSILIHNRLFSFDIIHFHWVEYIYMPHPTLLGRLAAVVAFILLALFMKYIVRNKIVITFHNTESHSKVNPKIENLLFRFCITVAHALIVHNQYSKKQLCKIYKVPDVFHTKIHVIPHGDFSCFYPNTISRKMARQKLGISDDAYVMLVFGEMRAHTKGIEDVLSALEQWNLKKEQVYIVFAGKPKDQSLVKRIQSFRSAQPDNVLCHFEYVLDQDVQIYMNSCDVGLIPYRKISTSGSVMLYASFNVPVIVSKLPPIVEVLGEDYPFYCFPHNASDLRTVIRKAQSAHNNEYVYKTDATCYNWKDIALQTETVYEAL